MAKAPSLTAMAAISLALACGHAGHAAGVFLPVETPVPASQRAQAPAADARPSRLVRIAHNELRRARAEVDNFDRGHLVFNMSEQLQLDVTVERTARTLNGYTLSGQIDGGKGGFVTLAVHGQTVAGSIWTWEANYEIAPVGGGVHAVRQVADEPLECGGVVQAQPIEHVAPAPTTSTHSEDAVVDILVFWTPARERRAGGETAVRAEIDLAVAFTNDAFERSGALVSLNLVGAELLDVDETLYGSASEHLDLLKGAHATQRAEALGADFVNLAVTAQGGAAYIPEGLSVSDPRLYVFAHEIGHHFYVYHDRLTHIAPNLSYSGGYSFVSTIEGRAHCHVTIMSGVGRCSAGALPTSEIPYYASPLRHHPLTGQPLGVSSLSDRRDSLGPADAVLTINRLRHSRANIRTDPSRQ